MFFDDLASFVGWYPVPVLAFFAAMGILFLVSVYCNAKMKYEKLKLGYSLIPDGIGFDALYGFIGTPDSQFAGPGTMSCHYAFRSGLRKGVYMFVFDVGTQSLVHRDVKWL